MQAKKASLIICHESNDFRALKEIEGSNSRYFNASNETKSRVNIVPASEELLKSELAKLSIIIDDVPSIKIVAEKFYKELVTIKGGRLAWDEDTHKGFFEIV